MNQNISNDVREVMGAVHYRPSVSIILPVNTRVNLTSELQHTLKLASDKVEVELKKNYPEELSGVIMQKLRSITKEVKPDGKVKSVALFVSPVFEKLFYLDVSVEEKIIIDESFEIRDLLYSRKQKNHFLIFMLSARQSRMYAWNTENFARIITDYPEEASAYENEAPERVANFSDMSDRKEINLQKFLQQMDISLGQVLKDNPFPVMVVGAEKVLGHFRQLTKNGQSIISYVSGNHDADTLPQLTKLLMPHAMKHNHDRQQALLKIIEEAAGAKKMVSGIIDSWKAACQQKARLLIVEKDFMYPAEKTDQDDIEELQPPYNRFSYLRDAVDDLMEKVLSGGGDVEFVNNDMLKDHGRIVLLQYY